MTEPLEQAKKSIVAALIGSCECNTKSPEATHHLAYCRYLKLLTALDCLDEIEQAENERAYERQQERFYGGGGAPGLQQQQIEARKLK